MYDCSQRERERRIVSYSRNHTEHIVRRSPRRIRVDVGSKKRAAHTELNEQITRNGNCELDRSLTHSLTRRCSRTSRVIGSRN